ncbi:MAG: shikimate dehydrogenase, partial [Nanoarchaeota archaeon]|nr:shikimate dehydrogenase [Nanoarchaeota archaeon]
SVTLPHKRTVMQFLDRVHGLAQHIGAVNTILNVDGVLTGYNTDCEGAMRALEETTALSGKKVVLLGSGGAARAIAFGLQEKNADVLILNRTPEKALDLAKATSARFGDLSMLSEVKKSDILINATSAGMLSGAGETLVPKEMLHENLTVFDIVYNPQETTLITEAKKTGCDIIYGYKMFLYQAVLQFELFTGSAAPVSIMEETLLKNLEQ